MGCNGDGLGSVALRDGRDLHHSKRDMKREDALSLLVHVRVLVWGRRLSRGLLAAVDNTATT